MGRPATLMPWQGRPERPRLVPFRPRRKAKFSMYCDACRATGNRLRSTGVRDCVNDAHHGHTRGRVQLIVKYGWNSEVSHYQCPSADEPEFRMYFVFAVKIMLFGAVLRRSKNLRRRKSGLNPGNINGRSTIAAHI